PYAPACPPAKNGYPDCSPKAAQPSPPAATSSPPSTASRSPTATPAPCWTASPPPNARSWRYSTSRYRESSKPTRHPTVRKTRLVDEVAARVIIGEGRGLRPREPLDDRVAEHHQALQHVRCAPWAQQHGLARQGRRRKPDLRHGCERSSAGTCG